MLALGMRRVAVFTDERVASLGHADRAIAVLRAAGIDAACFDAVRIEPTDASVLAAADFARDLAPDGYVSVGGGSVIDTAKIANLLASWPAALLDYVNAPIGAARPVPGPLKPHIACPTTSGTGSEVTGIAIFDLLSLHAKTGIAHAALRPTEALIDPDTTATLPATVVACSGLDVLSHALESYTARPYTARERSQPATSRPMSQGANPWSDIGCREALRLIGRYLVRAVGDAGDAEAREQMMWAATLAGIAFGNAGVHLPHGMSYAVAGLVRDYRAPDYPDGAPIIPHGMSVILNAPAVFRHTAAACPQRHLEAAALLGADTRGAQAQDAGGILAEALTRIMRAVGMPPSLSAVGYGESDVPALVEGAYAQQRLLRNAPLDVDRELLARLFSEALGSQAS